MNAVASHRRDLPETLQNIPAELPGVVCEQSVRRGNKRYVYYARFWREDGRLRKQYIRKAEWLPVALIHATHSAYVIGNRSNRRKSYL